MLNGNNSFYQNMFTSIQNGEGEFLMDTNAPNLATKDITENGTYNASSDNADGYSSVTVDVSSGGETFEVVFTSDGESVTTVNKTYNEIISAINSGKEIVGSLVFPDGSPLASVPIVKAIVADVTPCLSSNKSYLQQVIHRKYLMPWTQPAFLQD